MDTSQSIRKKLYVLTGFLGAGKTTLMKELFRIFKDKRIAVIENEFGQEGIDGIILKDSGVKVTEINNGSIFCVCRSDLFVEALLSALNTDAEIVLVETSGLSDPTGLGKILDIVYKLSEDQFDYAGTISVVDATSFLKLIHTAVAVSQQIVSSQLVLINKIDLANEETVQKIEEEIWSLNPKVNIQRTTFSRIHDKKWIDVLDTSFGVQQDSIINKRTIGTQKLLLSIQNVYSKQKLEKCIGGFSDLSYRIKGFVNLCEGWHYVDGIGGRVSILPTDIQQDKSLLIILAAGDSPVRTRIIDSWSKVFEEPINIL